MNYKRLDGVAVKAAPAGTAEVIIATLDRVDHDGDVLRPGAIGSQTVALLPTHDASSVPLGKARTRESGGKVYADLKFNLAIPAARDWHAALTFDIENPPAVQEYSWGYAAKSVPGTLDGRRVMFLEDVRLHEVSMVLRGASIGTGTVAVKCDGCHTGVTVDPAVIEAKRRLDVWRAETDASDHAVREELLAIKRTFERNLRVADGTRDFCEITGHDVYEVGTNSVPAERARVAKAAAEHFAARLNVHLDGLRFFRQPGPFTLYGRAHPATKTVFINAALSDPVEIWTTVGHEVGHLAGWDEPTCRKFETEILKEMTNAA